MSLAPVGIHLFKKITKESLKKTSIYISILCLCSFQNPPYTTPSSEAIHYYQQAENFFARKQYTKAIDFVRKSLTQDQQFLEPYLLMSRIHLKKNDFTKAVAVLSQGTSLLAKKKYEPFIYTNFATRYYRMGMYKLAHQVLQYSQKHHSSHSPDPSSQNIQQKINFSLQQIQNPIQVTKTILPSPLNQFDEQYFPILSLDEKTIYFTAIAKRDHPQAKENIYVSHQNTLGQWSKPIPISHVINTHQANEGTCTIAAHGKTLIFASSKKKTSGEEVCDLYISHKKQGQWSTPKALGPQINAGQWNSQPSLSADGKTLYFVSDRKENYGKKDIWKSTLQPDGTWTTATNLGPVINTHAQECAPFIHPNGQTLFFASNGRLGMGGFDIYYSNWINQAWTPPKNIGYPINHHHDQLALFITANGKRGYYADGQRKGNLYNNSRLYTCFFATPITDCLPVGCVQGTIIHTESQQTIEAHVIVYDTEKNKKIAQWSADTEDGQYCVVLPQGKKYHLYFQKPGYIFQNLTIDFRETCTNQKINISLTPIKIGTTHILKNIFFDFNQAILKKNSQQELAVLTQWLKNHPNTHVMLEGHTDDIGSDIYNQQLSVQRAKAVYDYLIHQGISRHRLTYQGFGKTKPLPPPSYKKKNRRTAYKIISHTPDHHGSSPKG